MSDDLTRRSGTEFVLEALRADIHGYQARVDGGFEEMRSDLREHIREEREWQRNIEGDLRKAVSVEGRVGTLEAKTSNLEPLSRMEPRVGALEIKVGEHSSVFEKTKGALIGARALWVLIGVIFGGIGWMYSQLFGLGGIASSKTSSVHTIYLPSAPSAVAPIAPSGHSQGPMP